MLGGGNELDPQTRVACSDAARAFDRLPPRVALGQALEIDLMTLCKTFRHRQPLVPGGPLYPFLSVLIAGIYMLRGLAMRSMATSQLKMEHGMAVLRLYTRKSCQKGTEKEIPLPCLCHRTEACPRCSVAAYLSAREKEKRNICLFINAQGGPVSASALRLTFAQLGSQLGTQRRVRPHSARVGGARLWYRLGASLASIGAIGDWSDEKTLKHYIGTLVMVQQFKKGATATVCHRLASESLQGS